MNKTLLDLSELLPTSLDEYILRNFIIERLPKRHYQAWVSVRTKPNCSSSVVAIELGISGNQTNNLLSLLVKMNLIERDKSFGVWKYRVKE